MATVSDDGTLRTWDKKTGRPHWRAPLMLENPPLLFTHQGWSRYNSNGKAMPSTTQWQKAVDIRAKLASATPLGETLCIATFADEIEIWDIPSDERSFKSKQPAIQQVIAIRNGCLLRIDEMLILTKATGSTVPLGKQVESLSRVEDSVFVLQGGKVRIFELDGNQQEEFTAISGASALTIVGNRVALGFPDGRIEVWKRDGSSARRDLGCREIESSPVTTVIPGPPNAIIAGFANGSLGIWSVETGERLYSHHLHGPVIHLLHQDQSLWAVSELGSQSGTGLVQVLNHAPRLLEATHSVLRHSSDSKLNQHADSFPI